MDVLLDVKEAAAALHLQQSTIRAWILQRRIPFVRIGRRVFLRYVDVEDYITDHIVPPKSQREAQPERSTESALRNKTMKSLIALCWMLMIAGRAGFAQDVITNVNGYPTAAYDHVCFNAMVPLTINQRALANDNYSWYVPTDVTSLTWKATCGQTWHKTGILTVDVYEVEHRGYDVKIKEYIVHYNTKKDTVVIQDGGIKGSIGSEKALEDLPETIQTLLFNIEWAAM